MLDRVVLIIKDGSGTISISELKMTFGDHLPENVWQDIVKEADENGDGEVKL